MPKHYSAAQKLRRKTGPLEKDHSHLTNVNPEGARKLGGRIARHKRAHARLLAKSKVGKPIHY